MTSLVIVSLIVLGLLWAAYAFFDLGCRWVAAADIAMEE